MGVVVGQRLPTAMLCDRAVDAAIRAETAVIAAWGLRQTTPGKAPHGFAAIIFS